MSAPYDPKKIDDLMRAVGDLIDDTRKHPLHRTLGPNFEATQKNRMGVCTVKLGRLRDAWKAAGGRG